jgi:hypothetical protein
MQPQEFTLEWSTWELLYLGKFSTYSLNTIQKSPVKNIHPIFMHKIFNEGHKKFYIIGPHGTGTIKLLTALIYEFLQ